jgi:DNA-binding MarR family transcriptional regulator
MDYIRQLGPVVLDHRFRRLTEALLRTAQEIYDARGLEFRSRWASTFQLLHGGSPLAVGEIATRLRLTHPGVIGITNEMISVGIARAATDDDDARRRIIALTAKGRRLAPELFAIWEELGDAQRKRFLDAGVDIVPVIDKVDDGLAQRSLSAEVLERLGAKKQSGRRLRATAVHSLLILAVCGFSGVAIPACAQSQVDQAAKAALISAVSDTVTNSYIYEKTGRMLADTLRGELSAGAYDGISNPDSLALRITGTLRRISNDKHLGVRYGSAPGGGAPMIRRVAPSGGTAQPSPATPSGPGSASPAPRMVRASEGAEYGFAKAEVLPGNIGYLDLRGFSEAPEAIAVADSVMAIFANVTELIIDLGANSGGGPSIVRYLSAYLFEKPTHLVSTFARGMDAPMERWTSERVTGKRLPNVPVYILTSRRTFSAAESFTFGLRVNHRVTIVGERTGGGGHFGNFVQLAAGFYMFVPRGRTYDPKTNEGWEAEGIKPDVEVSYDQALKTAIGLILERR